MKEKIKFALTVVLLAFASFTFAFQLAKEFKTTAGESIKLREGLNVVCTHAAARCTTCLTVEKLTKESLDEYFPDELHSGEIVFQDLDYTHPDASQFAEKYNVATASVVLVLVRNGETIAEINLANEVWKLHTDETAFKTMLKEQIESVLQGKILEPEDSPQEMIFEDEDISVRL